MAGLPRGHRVEAGFTFSSKAGRPLCPPVKIFMVIFTLTATIALARCVYDPASRDQSEGSPGEGSLFGINWLAAGSEDMEGGSPERAGQVEPSRTRLRTGRGGARAPWTPL